MKNLTHLAVGLAFLAISGCAPKVDLEAEKAKVKAVVDQFGQLLETEDMALFSKIMAQDPDMVNFGTDAAERWVGYETLKESVQQQFAAFDSTKLSVRDQVIKVHDSGNVAWFSEVADWDVAAQGQPVHIAGSRITGVLEKRNGNWVFAQFHASVPVSGQAAQY
jgi:ketosteroid isomerase-like protein